MIVVERPTLFHAQCLVTGRGDPEHGPYIDLVRDFDFVHQGRMYVSVGAVRQMAKLLEEPDRQIHEVLTETAEELLSENERLRKENEDLSRQLDAIDALESAGFQTRQRKQTKRKEPVHAQA